MIKNGENKHMPVSIRKVSQVNDKIQHNDYINLG